MPANIFSVIIPCIVLYLIDIRGLWLVFLYCVTCFGPHWYDSAGGFSDFDAQGAVSDSLLTHQVMSLNYAPAPSFSVTAQHVRGRTLGACYINYIQIQSSRAWKQALLSMAKAAAIISTVHVTLLLFNLNYYIHLYLYSVCSNQFCLQVLYRNPDWPPRSNSGRKVSLLIGQILERDQADIGGTPTWRPAD